MQKYILGGGIAGLIAAFYNPSYKIISKDKGGQMANGFLGPRILEVNNNSKRLLKDLDFQSVQIKTAKIGYSLDGRLTDSIDEENRKKYYIKSRCLSEVDGAHIIPSSIMSDGKNEIHYFDIGWDDIINKISERMSSDSFIEASVIALNPDTRELKIKHNNLFEEIVYDRVISTLPAPVFCTISNTEPYKPFEFKSKKFIIVKQEYVNMGEYDYVYYPGNELYHRMTKLPNGYVAVEYTTDRNIRNLMRQWYNITNKSFEMKIGQIVSGMPNHYQNVKYVGRYACWNHDIKSDDVVMQAVDIHCKEYIEDVEAHWL